MILRRMKIPWKNFCARRARQKIFRCGKNAAARALPFARRRRRLGTRERESRQGSMNRAMRAPGAIVLDKRGRLV